MKQIANANKAQLSWIDGKIFYLLIKGDAFCIFFEIQKQSHVVCGCKNRPAEHKEPDCSQVFIAVISLKRENEEEYSHKSVNAYAPGCGQPIRMTGEHFLIKSEDQFALFFLFAFLYAICFHDLAFLSAAEADDKICVIYQKYDLVLQALFS